MALTLAPKGVRVNGVQIGGNLSLSSNSSQSSNALLRHVDSSLVDPDNGNYTNIPNTNRLALNKTGSVHDVAAAVRFLASDDASFVTGQTIYVDGGASLKSICF